MRQYILSLTRELATQNEYVAMFERFGDQEFIQQVKYGLYADEVRRMNSETLGKIMCAFEIEDVMASKEDLFNGVTFSGDCEEMLRELVSLCLAYMIRDRLDDRT